MLTFCGVPLSIADPEGQVQAWIDVYRPLDNLLCKPASYREGRDREQGHWGHAVGLPVNNWRLLPPAWRVNTLWWPTGASRFAVGLFLATKISAAKIAALVGADGSGTLKIGDGQRTISPTMYLLPPRPIGCGAASNPVVLLPLVDRRYFWQWAKAGDFLIGPSSTWATIRTQITTNLGVAVTASDPSGYPAPDWSEFDRWYENPALLLDGYASSVGQRFVAALDGSYRLETWETAAATVLANLAAADAFAGGGVLASRAVVPGQLSVVFAKRQGGIVHANGACDGYAKLATEYGFAAGSLGDVTIHSTFQSNRSARGSNPDNLTDLQTLAGVIAEDWYGWRKHQYSATLPGVASGWGPTGYDDYLWFFANAQRAAIPISCSILPDDPDDDDDEDGAPLPDVEELPSQYLTQTLVESLPPNFGAEENLAQATVTGSPRTFRPSGIHRAELTSGWTNPGSGLPQYATARLLYESSGANPPTGVLTKDPHDVKIFDTLGIKGSLASASKLWIAALPADSEMFELIGPPPGGAEMHRLCRLDGSLAAADRDPNDLISASFGGMPSVTGTLYKPSLDGSDLEFASDGTGTIYNPTPFTHDNSDKVWVKKMEGFWLVDRPLIKPFARVNVTGVDGTSNCLTYSIESNKGGMISLPSSDTIQFDCPVVSGKYKIDCTISGQYLQGSEANWSIMLRDGGPTGTRLAVVFFDGQTDGGTNLNPIIEEVFSLAYSSDETFSQGATKKLAIVTGGLTGITPGSAFAGTVCITPMFE
jgi:hypothetical protein